MNSLNQKRSAFYKMMKIQKHYKKKPFVIKKKNNIKLKYKLEKET